MKTRLLKVEIRYEHDVVLARQRARQVASLLGFSSQDQVRIATSVSEIVRNAFRYAGVGTIEFFLKTMPQPSLRVIVTDRGSGIVDLQNILEGNYVSRTGMGLGLCGVKRLMDKFQIDTNAKGTTVELGKYIPDSDNEFNQEFFAHINKELSQNTSEEPFVELQQQNQELLSAFNELEKRKNQLTAMNDELEEAKNLLNLQNEQLEVRVARRTAELRESLQQMERFCYSIAHDLKAPLRAISGLTTILKEDYAPAFDEAGKICTDRIIEASTRMDILIRDLLDYGRLTHMDVQLSAIDLNHEVKKCLDHLHGEILSTKAVIKVEKNLPTIRGNAVLVQQVLCNLFENGLKFVKAGVIPRINISTEMKIWHRKDGADVDIVRFSVKDNGIGIDELYRERIFKVFERLHAEKSAYPGTGIGLALVQRAIERMNGLVGLESIPDEGATFWFELPTQRVANEVPSELVPAQIAV